MVKRYETKIGDKTVIIETGKYAKLAAGSCTVQCGETVVLVTCAFSKEPRKGIGFFPLTVEYQEKTYAAGKIPGGFFKREGRPSEKEILTARLIDRPIRPLFPKGCVNDVQVMAIVLSSDGQNDSDILALIGASFVLSISNIPFAGPIGAVRVGMAGDDFIVNPTYDELENSSLDMVVVAAPNGVIMLEGKAAELSEEDTQKAIDFGYNKAKAIIDFIAKIAKEIGKPKVAPEIKKVAPELLAEVKKLALSKLDKIDALAVREERAEAFDALSKEIMEKLVTEDSPYEKGDIKDALTDVQKEKVRRLILDKKKRIDGRSFTDVRPITAEVGMLPRTHGSGLFTRGQTQSLAVTTLGTSADEQMIDALKEKTYKSFMLHYNFPPFSVGEVKPVRGPGRREIGHGALAEKSLKPVMPDSEKFPYTIRIVSDILESNGSSSMATVCASTLSLMDAGVPIKAPVSGIAMGLVKEGKKEILLTDIGGVEDFYGDMDFKVAGTRAGITAVQVDLKIDGISMELIGSALKQARDARMHILGIMEKVMSGPKESVSQYAPQIVTLHINTEKIGGLIGPAGKNVKKIIADTGASIDIDDDGTVQIAAMDPESLKQAVEAVKKHTVEAEIGKIYMGKVKKIAAFGAFCEILPGKDGLVHVSELSDKFVKNIEDEIKVGDEFPVKVLEVDSQGKVRLSRKQAVEGRAEEGGHEKRHREHRKDKGKR